MKHLSTLVFSLLFLSSCGSDTISPAQTPSGLTALSMDTYTISVPSSWDPVDSVADISLPTGQLEIAYRSGKLVNGFANNVVVLSEKMHSVASAIDYSQKSIYLATNSYVNFSQLDAGNILLSDGQKSRYYLFEAQYNAVYPKTLFFQSAGVCGDQAYLITVGVAHTTPEDTFANYRSILESFACND